MSTSSSFANPTRLYRAVNSSTYSSWPRDLAGTPANDPAPDEPHSATMSRPGPNESFTLSRTEASITALAPAADPDSAKKRRREPDWNEFYRNGLPKEIIVIGDSPEPTANIGRKLANRRRKDDAVAPSHVDYVASHATPLQSSHPNDVNISSERTSATLNTTAPTSLSSNSQRDEAAPSFEHRRTTRRRTAAEAKRKALDKARASFLTYEPPPNPPKKVSNVHVRVIQDHLHQKDVSKVDDDDGHYIVIPDAKLTEKYEINRLLGQGTFGKVVEARDRARNKAVAVKIIRSVQKYRDASRIELRVLATLKANDERNRNQCIHLRDCFDYRGHICIVTDLLGKSVFDFLKGNSFVPFPNSHIQHFARQLFTSVAFLHDLNLIHTDLKPENILLLDDSYQTFTEIRLIDFGSATFQDEYHSSVVSTRHYRAPEIILGLGWSFPCDIWSIGIDTHLVQEVNKLHARSSGSGPRYFKRLKLDYPTSETTRGSRRFVNAMKKLQDIVPPNNAFLKHFLDLLKRIFVYDYSQRITAKQALNHPWFREVAQSDDGTEAAKIRMEKERLEQATGRHTHGVP
ncbi:kinase [Hirsutella rhossiliensis]|uniref:Kinase n=1 Tax=Hirsutella rhossiliensis TaxID=111463 RepID=A0A9P8SIB1_9HYPO|nr:kinase [Hirsutella rhossiliensis]KAH0963706.1 kinase [Hirsutella rhossiliensis]